MQNIFIYINIVIILIYLIAMIGAYRRGFLFEAINLALTLFAFLVSWQLAPILAKKWILINDTHFSDILLKAVAPYLNVVVWFLIVLAFFKFINLFITPMFKKVSTIPFIGFFNRIFGLSIGFLHATFWMFLLSMFLALPFVPQGKEIRQNTFLAPINKYANETIIFLMQKVNIENLQNEMSELTIAFSKWLEKQDLTNE